ncbi:hypothetical protein ACFYZJ_31180 [Streptomyces sp. NPDC001848]|uniref:hypothetical protein n=1 Tax=Streptomyces sp. NPDC001848 TaxID=3364618 RepID=UPI0036B2B93B
MRSPAQSQKATWLKSASPQRARAAAARLPTVEGTPQFPTDAELEKARQTVVRGWTTAVSG